MIVSSPACSPWSTSPASASRQPPFLNLCRYGPQPSVMDLSPNPPFACFAQPPPSEEGPTRKVSRTFALKESPASGLDCLTCAILTRERLQREEKPTCLPDLATFRTLQLKSYTLHPTPYNSHPTPCTYTSTQKP